MIQSVTRSPLRVMDNGYYDWSPMEARPALRWPGDARLAVCFMLHFDSMDWYPPAGAVVPASLGAWRSGAYPRVPDVHTTSQYEYGNRVGGFRILDAMREHGLRPTVAMDLQVARRCKALVDQCLSDHAEFVGHGLSAETLINESMDESAERSLIQSTVQGLEEVVGQRVDGWMGSECGESSRTVRLLAELGLNYVCDWPTDEQPHWMRTPGGDIVNLPFMLDIDDVHAHYQRGIPIRHYARMLMEQFDRLYVDGRDNGRLMLLNIHPWVLGHPFRIRYFKEVLAHLMAHREVWFATAGEVRNAWVAGDAERSQM